MDLVKLNISYGFIRERTRLTWREVLFGMDNELIAFELPVDMAVEQLGSEENPARALVDLAGLEKRESPCCHVEALANGESSQSLDELQGKWLYLALAWVLFAKARFSDPLQKVEEIYADFGYPGGIAPFVRYMPSEVKSRIVCSRFGGGTGEESSLAASFSGAWV
ncbi:DUF2247 family protein [Corallococcus sp. M34]|uniref:DUF2247 family protein n=1 Tax=Citreicoccus inhibens TaxID=2849499 RepID=UPI001C22B675|nr:DUF2247 family protein [Citreicoccus inhibens]MBU8900116.1 DUF2247 family protein [Citreicoccus inhibens]